MPIIGIGARAGHMGSGIFTAVKIWIVIFVSYDAM
jgi:hypothetical protein